MACYIVRGFMQGRGPVDQALMKQEHLRHIGGTYPGGPVYFVCKDVPSSDKNFHVNRIDPIDPVTLKKEFEDAGVCLPAEYYQPNSCGVFKLTEITSQEKFYYPDFVDLGRLIHPAPV